MRIFKNYHPAAIIVLALGLVCAILCGIWHQSSTYVFVDGSFYPRKAVQLDISGIPLDDPQKLSQIAGLEELDLRGTGITVEAYENLRQSLPECNIRWSIPFQGGFYDDDTQQLTVTSLTDEDVAMLGYFPRLTQVDARECRDYDQLLALQEAMPNCEISYSVPIGSKDYDRNAVSLNLFQAEADELKRMLPHFPKLRYLTLTGTQTDIEPLLELTETFPQIEISWDMDLWGITVNSLASEIDISGAPVDDLAKLEDIMVRLPNVERVIMSDCGISNEDMDALNRRHEDIRFIWTVQVSYWFRLRTDVTRFIPVKRGYLLNDDQLYNLRYCTDMVALDLGHNKITNIDFVAYMPHLRYLIFADTRVSDLTPLSNLKELVYLELFMTSPQDYSPLLGCTALEDLNLCYTRAPGDVDVIAQMTWLKRLWWKHNQWHTVNYADQERLREALPNTVMDFNKGSSTGNGWRQGYLYYEMRDYFGMWYMTG